MFINCLKYLRNQHIELPIQKLEIIFLWGDKTVNKTNNGEIIYDLINDLLITLMNEFKNSFMEELSPFIIIGAGGGGEKFSNFSGVETAGFFHFVFQVVTQLSEIVEVGGP